VKQRYADSVLKFLEEDFGMEGLRESIEVCELFTPEDFRFQRNSHLGSAWGLQPKLTQTAYLRPHNRSEDVPNLYFVGTSTHPGAGVPGVLLTAETTEKIILDDFKMTNKSASNGQSSTPANKQAIAAQSAATLEPVQ
jgi:phytoene desaturase